MNQVIDLSSLSPVEADTLYVERLNLQNEAGFTLDNAARMLIFSVGKTVYVADHRGRSRTVILDPTTPSDQYPTTYENSYSLDAKTALKRCNEGFGNPRYGSDYTDAYDAYVEASALVTEVEQEYARRPWRRYWLVTSSDGHIHSSTYCSTCNKGKEPTGFALVPYLSGSDVNVAVADLGAALCSVCFPEAPVESREQFKISARLALTLKEQGVEAFQRAREKARADAAKRSAERCEGSGQWGNTLNHWHVCPVCGWSQRVEGKMRPHRRPRFYAILRKGYDDKYWNGASWGASTKKVAFETREEAQAVVDANGGTKIIIN